MTCTPNETRMPESAYARSAARIPSSYWLQSREKPACQTDVTPVRSSFAHEYSVSA